MLGIVENRRAGGLRRLSEIVLADGFTDTATPSEHQCAWLTARWDISAATARVIAEHHFTRRASR